MSLYGTLFDRVLYPAWEKAIRRRPTLDLRAKLERTQWATADELVAIQNKELARLLRHAYANVPFYRRRFDEAGVTPDPENLASLPVFRRDEAQATSDLRTSTAPPFVAVKKSTSGTNGQPLAFGYDRLSEYWRQAIKQRGYAWAGYRIGMPALHFWGPAPPPKGLDEARIALDRTLKREMYVDCTKRGDADLANVVRIIEAVRPHAIVAYTAAAVDLARWVLANERRTWGTIPVICAAEKLWPQDRALLVEAFGPSVFDTYGSRETMLLAAECEAHDGLHVQSENVVVEILVTENGATRAAEPGEIGEVVVTDLHNYAMPFIRYANGDLAVRGKRARCACGRSLPRIASVEGRVADTLRDGRGGKIGGMIFMNAMVPLAGAVREFQAVQHADDSVTLKVVPTRAWGDDARAHVARMMRDYLGDLSVKLELVDEIPLGANGKRRTVVVEAR
jgi:phenylacetate-CoA ligase